jgi:hypothetical protein
LISINYFNPFYQKNSPSFSTKAKRFVVNLSNIISHKPKKPQSIFAKAERYYQDIACKIDSIINQNPIFKNRFFVSELKFLGGILCKFIFWNPLLPVIKRSLDSINPYLGMDIGIEKLCSNLSLQRIFEAVVMAPLIEEVVFRGILQDNNFDKVLKFITRKKTNPKLSRIDKILKFLILKKPTNKISRSDFLYIFLGGFYGSNQRNKAWITGCSWFSFYK